MFSSRCPLCACRGGQCWGPSGPVARYLPAYREAMSFMLHEKAGAGRASLFSVFSAPKTPPSSGTKQATPLHLIPCLVLCLDNSDSPNTLSWHENG